MNAFSGSLTTEAEEALEWLLSLRFDGQTTAEGVLSAALVTVRQVHIATLDHLAEFAEHRAQEAQQPGFEAVFSGFYDGDPIPY